VVRPPISSVPRDSGIRLAELMASLSVATDLAMGQPVEYALCSSVLAVHLGAEAGLSDAELRNVYYQGLLRYIGCNAQTDAMAAVVGDEIALRTEFAKIDAGNLAQVLGLSLRFIRNANPGASPLELLRAIARGLIELGGLETETFPGHCEVAQRLGERLGFAPDFVRGLGQLYARWDGKGVPRIKGEAIMPAVRLVVLAQDMVTFHRLGGIDAALAVARQRRAKQYDPALVDLFLRAGPALLSGPAAEPRWESVLALEPGEKRRLSDSEFDHACLVLADFADIKSPWTLTHSKRVSAFAADAAARLGLDATLLRRAGLLHDVGRVGVSAGIWGKPAALSDSQWEKVRLHAYHTERVLSRSPALAALGRLASSAHERMDGSGYFRASAGAAIDRPARILAAADVYSALTEARPHRLAYAPEAAAGQLRAQVAAGALEREAVEAVLAATGHAPVEQRIARPAGLSGREAEVLGLLARGNSNKAIARHLGVSPKTVDNQVQSIYAKAEVRTRAGATLFAMEHGLLP
jgi:HD-GYP domain-containing protein (c-di-GMP phosphodiesterase class II)